MISRRLFLALALCASAAALYLFLSGRLQRDSQAAPIISAVAPTTAAEPIPEHLERYSGPVRHIFFHSLIIYPELALKAKQAALYANNMITVDQFKSIIAALYGNGFILIDPRTLYSTTTDGSIRANPLLLPLGKKPLVISQDDLAYYDFMRDGGFASKLVLDDGSVKTRVIAPDGIATTTDDGDVVPLIDSFVREHPDFSFHGAKGVLALTGFEGILGYRTQSSSVASSTERTSVKAVIDALKASGWIFASHSYSHERGFLDGTISTTTLASDIVQWKDEVGSLVGSTDIFVGPFGQLFAPHDPRRQQIVDAGFDILYGVGLDAITAVAKKDVVIDRVDIDGYRLAHNAPALKKMLGI